ncbi:MAG: hypothetical protein IJM25_06725 [Eubacterium sp.]|nr:hypothetical protein [Eubacterium sp.]
MSDTSKKALIALLGIAIIFLAYMYVFKPAKEDADKLETECKDLQVRLDDLIQKEAQKETLLAETEEFKKQFNEVLNDYPADLNQEVAVMFFKSIEENNEFVNNTFSMPKENEFYKLGASAGAVVGTDALSGANGSKDAYSCTTTSYSINYKGSYAGIKSVLEYVANYKYRMAIPQINIAYDRGTDTYQGTVLINAYAISGPDRTPDTVDPGVPAGTSNIFVAGDGSSSAGPSSKYDADQGAAIVGSNNLVIMLNSANSDLSSGVIVASNVNKDDTYVTSNDNARVALNISVYNADGKNYVEYSVGTQKYTAEILSSEVAILVKSSARVDSSDANGVDVTVTNTSGLPVYFKVVDDDATNPRYKLVGRSGVIKEYK